MKTEIEVKFLNVDFDEVRAKLTAIGGICEQPMRLMRRALVDTPELTARHAFLRLRDEGDKATMTMKQFTEKSLTGAKEREVVISNFDDAVAILKDTGLPFTTEQESRRETWKVGDDEVVLDEWPWINPYIEIEGKSEESVKDTAAKLGFDWKNAVFGSVDVIYNLEYPHMSVRGVIDVPIVHFEDPIPEAFGKKV